MNFLPGAQAIKAAWNSVKISKTLLRVGKVLLGWSKNVKWAENVLAKAARAKDAGKAAVAKADDVAEKTENLAGASCPLHSFAPGTKVLLADGTTVPIEKVELGDKVLATDPETGKTEAKEVTHLYENADRDLTDIAVTVLSVGPEGIVQTSAVFSNHRSSPFLGSDVKRVG